VEEDWSTRLQTLDGHSGSVESVALSPDGLLASGSGDRTISLWNTATGTLQLTIEGHSNWVRSVAFSTDGRLLASGSGDKTIRLWGTTADVPHQTLDGHSNSVRSMAFSPDGHLLASGSEDQTVQFWDTMTGALQQTFHVNGYIDSLGFSEDGSCLLTNLGVFDVQSRSTSQAFVAGLARGQLDISIEKGQWIKMNGRDILWLPPESRVTCSAIVGNVLALGHSLGRVSFLGFCLECLGIGIHRNILVCGGP
jgi:WD40 repeat protein